MTGPGEARPPGPEDAEARIYTPARLLLPYRDGSGLEIFAVDPGKDGAASVRLAARSGTSRGCRVVGMEIGSSGSIHRSLDAIARAALGERPAALYFLTRTRSQLSAVLRLLRRRGIGPARVYGIDPDYYHAVLPLDGEGHRAVERYILGLKRRSGRAAALKALIRRVLVTLGLSRRLYEGFLVVWNRRDPGADRLDLRVES